MQPIDYDVQKNLHTEAGASAALKQLLTAVGSPRSLLDVGCGPGTWLRAALDLGVADVQGLEGKVPVEHLSCDARLIKELDLTSDWSLGRRFDVVICLEVAEHLPESAAPHLVRKLCQHGDQILFSAAAPGQPGQHHINCQWPAYWQKLFNQEGFVCNDDLRWKIWDQNDIEPWYRQNVFHAARNLEQAGSEPRIPAVVHPVIHAGVTAISGAMAYDNHCRLIEHGSKSLGWYPKAWCTAFWHKIWRRLSGA